MKKTHIIAIILVALGLAGVVAVVSDVDTYKTFNSAKELPDGKTATVIGELTEVEKIQFDPEIDPNLTVFYAKDKEGTIMKVKYFEPKPIDFERSEELTMTGEIVGEEFHTKKILMKCPSKYIDESLQDQVAKVN